jgi:acylphosphatase
MSPRSVRYVVRFTGQVQGVGFRATTLFVSQGLDVHGFVRNESDGSVKLDVDGPKASVKELLQRIQTSMGERIDDVFIDERPTDNRTGGLNITM